MADLALILGSPLTLDAPWRCIDKDGDFALYFNESEGVEPLFFTEREERYSAAYIGHPTHFAQKPIVKPADCMGISPTWTKHRQNLAEQWKGRVAGFVYDKILREANVFRDRLGHIPVVYVRTKKRLVFTTNPQLYLSLCKDLALNQHSLAAYLRVQHDESDLDWYEGSYRVLPASYCYGKAAALKTRSYWALGDLKSLNVDFSQASALIADAFDKSMRRAAMRRNPVLSLSGGLDSGAIAGWFCKNAEQALPKAYTLVSSKQRTSDESDIIDVWQSETPLQIQRIDMAQIPENADAAALWGPISSPGMHIAYALFQSIAKNTENATILTGFGGNFIVQSRDEVMMRECLRSGKFTSFFEEFRLRSRSERRLMAKRFLANAFHGIIPSLLQCLPSRVSQKLIRPPHPLADVESWLTAEFRQRHRAADFDPVFSMSQAQERAATLRSREWELSMRMLDSICRQCRLSYHDPLFDAEFFELCARIPARFWHYRNAYRAAWKSAIKPLLPKAVLEHPKIQSFDAHAYPEKAFDAEYIEKNAKQFRPDLLKVLNIDILSNKLRKYQACKGSDADFSPLYLWRAASLLRAFAR
ncbi:MAG: asparagine synthase-related protein [Bradymonadia bacterium]|jgi:hypothetical protein